MTLRREVHLFQRIHYLGVPGESGDLPIDLIFKEGGDVVYLTVTSSKNDNYSNRNGTFLLNVNVNCKQDTDNTLKRSVGQQEVSNTELDAANTTLNSSTSSDSGSESSFISENAINILELRRCNDRISLSGISGIQAGTTHGLLGLKIGSRFCEDQLTIKTYILNKVTSQIPIDSINIKELDYLKSIPLEDEEFSRQSECDVILDSDCFFSYFAKW
ncbi:DUF1758 domain-containing protein [Trichonephila clavata]|uniref:DUF1758 domain-containing protein n=1 Tax=Trichonephila clavata TaxID=2740835 RepID=A0A8X6LS00_TRICU|nr:DUF1758 domain-containing protein [Trichonephila clavata]